MKVIIAGGGSGGHLFPGIAVAEEFRQRDPHADILFIGTERGIEAKVAPKEGYPIKFINVEGVLGKSPYDKVRALWRLASSVRVSKTIIKAMSPDIVVGTGGYVSAGPVVSARLLSIPSLIMEQNLVPGLATRTLARLSDAVAVTYHESIPLLPRSKIFYTGNPVRKSVLAGKRAGAHGVFSLDEEKFTVLVLGGSSGARSINNAVVNALSRLLDVKKEVQFLHQTGEKDHETVNKIYAQWGFRAKAEPFLYAMAEAYAASDLVVSRAGATTLAELTALGKPSILIPYPHAGGHQEFNARKLEEMGACRVIPDYELNGDTLSGAVKEMLASKDALSEMGRRAGALGRPDAAQRVVDIAESLIKKKRGINKGV